MPQRYEEAPRFSSGGDPQDLGGACQRAAATSWYAGFGGRSNLLTKHHGP
jgi:hypothetical protein